jgi:hypothetical protein
MSLCDTTSASEGASLSVEMKNLLAYMEGVESAADQAINLRF